jgi:hypothetical protein
MAYAPRYPKGPPGWDGDFVVGLVAIGAWVAFMAALAIANG